MIEVIFTTNLDKFKHISLSRRVLVCLPNKGDRVTLGNLPSLEVYSIHHKFDDDEHQIEIELHIPRSYAQNGTWPKWIQETYFN